MRIVAPYFVAGLLLEGETVVDAAPIVRYMIGWTTSRVLFYAARKGWQVERL